jgi:hypothetical protein
VETNLKYNSTRRGCDFGYWTHQRVYNLICLKLLSASSEWRFTQNTQIKILLCINSCALLNETSLDFSEYLHTYVNMVVYKFGTWTRAKITYFNVPACEIVITPQHLHCCPRLTEALAHTSQYQLRHSRAHSVFKNTNSSFSQVISYRTFSVLLLSLFKYCIYFIYFVLSFNNKIN